MFWAEIGGREGRGRDWIGIWSEVAWEGLGRRGMQENED